MVSLSTLAFHPPTLSLNPAHMHTHSHLKRHIRNWRGRVSCAEPSWQMRFSFYYSLTRWVESVQSFNTQLSGCRPSSATVCQPSLCSLRSVWSCSHWVCLYSVIISQAAACYYTAPLDNMALLHGCQTRGNYVHFSPADEWTLTDGNCEYPLSNTTNPPPLQLLQLAIAPPLPCSLNEPQLPDKPSHAQGRREE